LVKRLIRAIFNSLGFIIFSVVAVACWPESIPTSIFMGIAALDQLEDVYYAVYGRRLMPRWLMPIDIVLELAVIAFGMLMLVYGLIYYSYFQTWFFKSALLLSVPMIYCAAEDIALWWRSEEHEVREKAFVKKR